jgi:bifunctional N-acetylglucosamine-1-phosphate-uridyltransferase/glucosamine-1-phosphate-acetyltransferase GlmU-like protein
MMDNDPDFDAACDAALAAERGLGDVLVTCTSAMPTLRAELMAQVLVAATLIDKLELSKRVIDAQTGSYGRAVQDVQDQLAAMPEDEDGKKDLSAITLPDGPDDYISVKETHHAH